MSAIQEHRHRGLKRCRTHQEILFYEKYSQDIQRKIEEINVKPTLPLNWGAGCQYRCTVPNCSSGKFNSYASFHIHINSDHNMSFNAFKRTYPNYYLKTTMFKCFLCNKDIIWDRFMMDCHMRSKHSTTAAQFAEDYPDKILALLK